MNNALTNSEINNLLILISRSTLKGEEASAVVELQAKLASMRTPEVVGSGTEEAEKVEAKEEEKA